MAEIMEKMIACDVMVLASPVYFYSIDAQLKAVIDRSVCRWTEVKNKEMYYIMTAADGEKESMDTTLACFRGYADCVEGAVEKRHHLRNRSISRRRNQRYKVYARSVYDGKEYIV